MFASFPGRPLLLPVNPNTLLVNPWSRGDVGTYILSHLKSKPLKVRLYFPIIRFLPTAVLGHRTAKQMTKWVKLLPTSKLLYTWSDK